MIRHLGLALALVAQCLAEQVVFPPSGSAGSSLVVREPRKLTGRFLHITDIHPDPYYKTGASFSTGCHRKAKKDKKLVGEEGAEEEADEEEDGEERWLRLEEDKAGKWGSAVSDCDSPMSLVNATFDWLKANWANEVDFVVWTGDNARHDIDRDEPRTPTEIFNLNRMLRDKMLDTFGEDVVIVPSLGNNDIYPHNILQPGPNTITNEFINIWNPFVPLDDYHVFQRGAYFSAEVIPDQLAVISLNTIYWYDANKAVDGCKDGSDEPGALQFDWLEVQLDGFRDRGMQVWLTGHVPPHIGHYFDNCYLRYGELALRYQDTIVGHLYGHMNLDHFFFIDVDELESSTDIGVSKVNAASLADQLKKDFGNLPKKKKFKWEDYAVVNVAPSVVPTYLPAVRVFSYNVTGLELDIEDDLSTDLSSLTREKKKKKKKPSKGGHHHSPAPKTDCSLPEHEDQPHCKFRRKPRYFSPHSPSRSNQLFTPLGYAQFFVPQLDKQTRRAPGWEIEYTTYTVEGLLRGGNGTDGVGPVPWHLLPIDAEEWGGKGVKGLGKKARRELKKITPFGMEDLTIPSWVRLARRLGEEKGLWERFTDSIFVGSGAGN